MKAVALFFFFGIIVNFPANISAQCPDDFFCAFDHEVEVVRDSIPLCEDVFDGGNDGFTDYVEFLGCRDGNDWVTRFFRKKEFVGCDMDNHFGVYSNSWPYQTVFFDDFLEDTLNTKIWLTRWNAAHPYDTIRICNNEKNVMFGDLVTIKNGCLSLGTAPLKEPLEFECEDANGNKKKVVRKYGTSMIQTYEGVINPGSETRFRYGKFTIRARVPVKKGTNMAFWFFGWAGEIDVIETCSPDCKEIQSNRWPYFRDPHSNLCDEKEDPLTGYSQDHDIGNIFKFREYELDWTPHKFTISVDGRIIRSFHRYWRIENIGGLWCATPLECEELPYNNEFEVFEHIAWFPLDHKMDMIISTGVSEKHGKPQKDEMLIDWVKIEQRTSLKIIGDIALCDDSEATFHLVDGIAENKINYWQVSPNVEIIGEFSNGIKIKANREIGQSDKAWVEANVYSHHNYHGLNIRKNITVGKPPIPEITVQKSCNAINLDLL